MVSQEYYAVTNLHQAALAIVSSFHGRFVVWPPVFQEPHGTSSYLRDVHDKNIAGVALLSVHGVILLPVTSFEAVDLFHLHEDCKLLNMVVVHWDFHFERTIPGIVCLCCVFRTDRSPASYGGAVAVEPVREPMVVGQ